ncbi:MAG: hypothetical protein GX161_09530 [Firmicutes bacterium]|nr:hypothetical protein [Bacillota bacterium]
MLVRRTRVTVFLIVLTLVVATALSARAEGRVCASEPDLAAAKKAVAAVAREFGSRLKLVSLLAPEDVLRRDIEEHFVDLVTPELLNKWLDDPTAAPGRLTSSPWPECIAVDEVKLDGTTRAWIRGHIVWVTSVELAEGGAYAHQAVCMELVRDEHGAWRIHKVCIAAWDD